MRGECLYVREKKCLMYMWEYVCYQSSYSTEAVIHIRYSSLISRNRTKNRVLLVGGFECHLLLSLCLSLSPPFFYNCTKLVNIIVLKKKNSPVSATVAFFSCAFSRSVFTLLL